MGIIRWCCLSMVDSTITQAVEPGYQRFGPALVGEAAVVFGNVGGNRSGAPVRLIDE
jgi:hypothetical protein